LWLHIVRMDDDDTVHIRLTHTWIAGFPFLRHLSPEHLAVLVLLHRQGPLSAIELASELACALPVMRRQLTFLLGTTLVQEDQRDRGLIRVTSTWAPYVGEALREVKAL
jgi:predicted transcriptional regulator